MSLKFKDKTVPPTERASETPLRMFFGPCRVGSTFLLKSFSQVPEYQIVYQPIKSAIRETGIPDFSIYHADYRKTLVSKETWGPHNSAEASFTAFRSFDDVIRTRPVFLIRNPVRVWNSWLSEGWDRFDVFTAAWENVKRHVMIASESGPNAFKVVGYEDLTEDPEVVLHDICKFWELPFYPEMLCLETAMQFDESLPGTADFRRSQQEGSFSNAERSTQIRQSAKKNAVSEETSHRIWNGYVGEIYSELQELVRDTSFASCNEAVRDSCAVKIQKREVEGSLRTGRSRVVATVGPASEDQQNIQEMILAGADVLRLNYSHGSVEEKDSIINRIYDTKRQLGIEVAILADMPGPKLRLGVLPRKMELARGDTIYLQCGKTSVTEEEMAGNVLPVEYGGLASDVETGHSIFLADGSVELTVVDHSTIDSGTLKCRVENNGVVSSRKGINCPDTTLSLPAVGARDIEFIKHAVSRDVELIAVSYVRSVDDLASAREILQTADSKAWLVAKIEHPSAIRNLESIVAYADAVMVARGDLGVEIPFERIPNMQEQVIETSLRLGKPVIVATEMLESMVSSPRPTRAEVADVFRAVRQGASATMLSAETATGKHPGLAVETMVAIANEAVKTLTGRITVPSASEFLSTLALAAAAVNLARDLDADHLIVATQHGIAATLVAAHRPGIPIHAITTHHGTIERLGLVPGASGILIQDGDSRAVVRRVAAKLTKQGLVRPGELIVVMAGEPTAISGTTSSIGVLTVQEDGVVRSFEFNTERSSEKTSTEVQSITGNQPAKPRSETKVEFSSWLG